jgi:hypothetical protein
VANPSDFDRTSEFAGFSLKRFEVLMRPDHLGIDAFHPRERIRHGHKAIMPVKGYLPTKNSARHESAKDSHLTFARRGCRRLPWHTVAPMRKQESNQTHAAGQYGAIGGGIHNNPGLPDNIVCKTMVHCEFCHVTIVITTFVLDTGP